MKRFILRFLGFIILLVLLVGIPYVLSDYYLNIRKRHYLTLDRDVKIVFAGDSNVECAANDRIVPHSVNIAQSGEHYMYTFIKLRALLEYNRQIETVFLSYAPSCFDKSLDEKWLFSDESVIRGIAVNYLLNYPEKLLVIRNSSKAYIKGLPKCTKSNLIFIIDSFAPRNLSISNFSFGGYNHLVRDKLQEDIKRRMSQQQRYEKGEYQERYLRLISQLCQQRSIRLILLNTPKHKYLTTNTSNGMRDYWVSVRKSLPSDSLLDLSEMALPDSCYGDASHLNYKGATVFSEYLRDKIQSAQEPMNHKLTMDHRSVN